MPSVAPYLAASVAFVPPSPHAAPVRSRLPLPLNQGSPAALTAQAAHGMFTLIADLETGEDRRRKALPTQCFLDNAPATSDQQLLVSLAKCEATLDFDSGFFERDGQDKIFWTSIVPKDKAKIENVLVFHHGLNDHCGWSVQLAQMHHAAMFNSAAVCFDMPGWGRSDGLFMHIPNADWFAWTSHAATFILECVLPWRSAWETQAGRQLKVFGHGESMGGAIALSLALKHPNLYDGIVLSAPAVNGAKEVLPHPAVVWFLMTFVVPFLGTLPQAPFEDVSDKCHEDKALVARTRLNPFSPQGKKLRFSTGAALVTAVRYISGHLSDVTTPFLVFHSEKDTVTSSASSQLLYEQASSPDKTITLWKEGWHADALLGAPLHKPLMQKAYALAGDWVRQRS